MPTYSLATRAARSASFDGAARSDFDKWQSSLPAVLPRIPSRLNDHERSSNGHTRDIPVCKVADTGDHGLQIFPSGIVSRRAITWDGVKVEIVQSVTHDKVEFRFRAPYHLLLVYEEGVRNDGETLVGGLPRSTLRNIRRKLTFVPAGREYREWQQPRVRSRVICFYFDPANMPVDSDSTRGDRLVEPRVFFENNALWETAVKLAASIEDGGDNLRYCESLGVVVAHELVRAYNGLRGNGHAERGGLAVWQQRRITSYIDEHLAEHIPLAALAELVRLSPYYFCRAFKQSIGLPPHRYHSNRRIVRAKTLLANPALSIGEIALMVGFSETSAFSAAFRSMIGVTPTGYRRNLDEAPSSFNEDNTRATPQITGLNMMIG